MLVAKIPVQLSRIAFLIMAAVAAFPGESSADPPARYRCDSPYNPRFPQGYNYPHQQYGGYYGNHGNYNNNRWPQNRTQLLRVSNALARQAQAFSAEVQRVDRRRDLTRSLEKAAANFASESTELARDLSNRRYGPSGVEDRLRGMRDLAKKIDYRLQQERRPSRELYARWQDTRDTFVDLNYLNERALREYPDSGHPRGRDYYNDRVDYYEAQPANNYNYLLTEIVNRLIR